VFTRAGSFAAAGILHIEGQTADVAEILNLETGVATITDTYSRVTYGTLLPGVATLVPSAPVVIG
jgi:hypothetical protein